MLTIVFEFRERSCSMLAFVTTYINCFFNTFMSKSLCLEFGHVSAHFEPFKQDIYTAYSTPLYPYSLCLNLGKLLLFVSVSDRTYKLHFECMRFYAMSLYLYFGKVSAHRERF